MDSTNDLLINSSSNITERNQSFFKEIKIRFRLRTPNSHKPSLLFLEVNYKGERIRLGIVGFKVYSSHWNKIVQRAYVSNILSSVDNRNNLLLNDRLDEIERKFKDFINYICNSKLENHFNFQLEVKKFMGRKKKSEPIPVDVFEEIKKACLNSSLDEKTIRENYIGKGIKALKEYSAYRDREGLGAINSFQMLTGTLFAEFAEYLGKGLYKKKDGSPYTIESINSIDRYAVSAVKLLPLKYLPIEQKQLIKQFSIDNSESEPNKIALSEPEILKLWKYQPETKEDEEIRDMFLLLCTIGIRGSDITSVDKALLKSDDGVEYLDFVQKKTSGHVKAVFVYSLAKEITDKYETLPTTNIKRKINKKMWRIAKDAGIQGKEKVITKYIGEAEPRIYEHERYELIKSHTGRRSFVTNLVLREWTYERIANYTGHKSIDTVKKYDKTGGDKAVAISRFKKLPNENKLELTDEFKEINTDSKEIIPEIKIQPIQNEKPKPSNNFFIDGLEEARSIMRFLEIEFTEDETFDDIIGKINWKHSHIFEQYGVDIEDLKAIYNMGYPLERKKLAIKAICGTLNLL